MSYAEPRLIYKNKLPLCRVEELFWDVFMAVSITDVFGDFAPCGTSSVVTYLFATIIIRTCSMMSSEADVQGHPDLASSFTVVDPFLNFSVHLFTLLQGNTMSPYCAEGLRCISAPETSSYHENQIFYAQPCFTVHRLQTN
jgi:hypothetical protein